MDMTKKIIIKLLIMPLLCIIIVFSFFNTSFSVKASDNNRTVLKVGVPVDRCPVFYTDYKTGEVIGIGADLLKIACENIGYDVSFKIIKESSLKEALDNPDYDIILPFGSAIKSLKGNSSVVSDNLFKTPFTLVTTIGDDMPKLDEIHVGMLSSLAGAVDTVKQMYPNMEITLYDKMDDCVKALRNDKVDALLHNSYVWSYVLQKPSYQDLKVHPDAMFSMDFKAGTLDTPRGREIIDALNEGISKITDTQRQAITLDYTSRSLYQYDFFDYLYKYRLNIILVSLLIIVLIIIAVMKNRSIRLKHEKKISLIVNHDALTGILSLEGFKKRAEELIHLHQDTPYLLIYTNIRNFKYINDSLGMSAGDNLLRFLANRVNGLLSEYEAMGRVNADRFVILYRNRGEEKIRKDDQKAFDPIRNFFIDCGKDVRVLLCYGIYVLTPEDYQMPNIDRMLDYAHSTEKKVRYSRNEGFEFYNHEQWEKGKQIANIINALPTAIESGDIQVWYQPQFDYKIGEITGAEALVRWKYEKKNYLKPEYFIPILEESGLIYNLDCFAWEQVCIDLNRWNKEGYHRHVSINVSRIDIREDRDISKHLNDLIKKYNISPDQLRIEITESAYVENHDILINTTKKLREIGFQVEMDDFGSGYSSLNMLKEVPVDRIKLDLNFLTSSGDSTKSHIILSCIIKMINLLGIKIIAEGVETIEQASFLEKQGCYEMQGYYFYKPMTVEEYEQLSKDNIKSKND